MYDIHSYFERRPDRAVHWIRQMRRLHPGWPIWGLKLAQLLGEPMGLWAQSAAVSREMIATAESGAHPNYQPVVAEMARVTLAEALLGDLRFEEACTEARRGVSAVPWVAERREKVLARCRSLQSEAASAEARALDLLARARRLAERGEAREAEAVCLEAFRVHPASDEARLCAARESLRAGRPAAARALARAVLDDGDAFLSQVRLALGEPLFLYHHPQDTRWDMVSSLIGIARATGAPFMSLGEYARWWRGRLRFRCTLQVESGGVRVVPGEGTGALSGDLGIRRSWPDGTVRLAAAVSSGGTGDDRPVLRRPTPPPRDIARMREADLRFTLGTIVDTILRHVP